jgi:hypothetical protein
MEKDYAIKDDLNTFFEWTKTWFPVWQEVMNINLSKTLITVPSLFFFLLNRRYLNINRNKLKIISIILKLQKRFVFI